MKFFDEIYVGFQKRNDIILGFAVPTEYTKELKPTANFSKRKETVNGWSDEKLAPKLYDNKPTFGFKLTDVVSRYSTSNKMFRVLDPRGFELEITTDNLLNIIQTSTITNGVIADEMVWASDNKFYLMSKNDSRYKKYIEGPVEFKLELGVNLINESNTIAYQLIDRVYVSEIHYSHVKREYSASGIFMKRRLYDNISSVNGLEFDAIYDETEHGKAKSFLYAYQYLNDEGDPAGEIRYEMRKSKIPNLVPSNICLSEPVSTPSNLNDVWSNVSYGSYCSQYYLFKDKQSFNDRVYDFDIVTAASKEYIDGQMEWYQSHCKNDILADVNFINTNFEWIKS